MNILLPKRIGTVNSKSYEDFLRVVAHYYPNKFTKKDLESGTLYAGYNPENRRDRIKAHADYAVDFGLISGINSHYEFVNCIDVNDYLTATKEGNVHRKRVAYARLLHSFTMTQEFLRDYGSKQTVHFKDILEVVKRNSSYVGEGHYGKATTFFIQALKKAGFIVSYKPKKKVIKLSQKSQNLLEVEQQPTLTEGTQKRDRGSAVEEYTIAAINVNGDKKIYKISFNRWCSILASLENHKEMEE